MAFSAESLSIAFTAFTSDCFSSTLDAFTAFNCVCVWRREERRKGGRERGREGGREEGREGVRKGGRERGREGGKRENKREEGI